MMYYWYFSFVGFDVCDILVLLNYWFCGVVIIDLFDINKVIEDGIKYGYVKLCLIIVVFVV